MVKLVLLDIEVVLVGPVVQPVLLNWNLREILDVQKLVHLGIAFAPIVLVSSNLRDILVAVKLVHPGMVIVQVVLVN